MTDQTAKADTGSLVTLRHHGTVVEIVLDRPGALNAISSELARQLAEAFDRVAGDPAARAAVLSSASKRAFCVGADLKERARFGDGELMEQRPVLRAAFDALRAIPAPVVAAVAGYALGGGFELALSCDLIVADETAELALPESRIGLVPGGGGTQLLVRRAGPGVAADLIFTGRRVAMPEARQLGLVDRVVAGGSARDEALAVAEQIAGNSPVAVRAAKRALRLGGGVDLASGFEVEDAAWRQAASSPDRVEGIAAFVAKRPPAWPSGKPAR